MIQPFGSKQVFFLSEFQVLHRVKWEKYHLSHQSIVELLITQMINGCSIGLSMCLGVRSLGSESLGLSALSSLSNMRT